MEKWKQFTSLAWYDGLIEFAFRFVAKTSEPLLAAGLVISAADYLSHGAVMNGHPAFSLGWAWAQALALESSSGVVFVYALQAFRSQDKVKGAIYLALALLLAIVGGGMLLLQVNAITMGTAENAIPVLNFMRVIVSIAYIFLLRAKSIRFSDLADIREQEVPVPVPQPNIDELFTPLIERLEEMHARRTEAIIEQVTRITIEQATNPAMPALPAPVPERMENLQPIYDTRFASKEQEVAAILARMPDASVEQVAQEAGCNVRTAEKWMKRLHHERTSR